MSRPTSPDAFTPRSPSVMRSTTAMQHHAMLEVSPEHVGVPRDVERAAAQPPMERIKSEFEENRQMMKSASTSSASSPRAFGSSRRRTLINEEVADRIASGVGPKKAAEEEPAPVSPHRERARERAAEKEAAKAKQANASAWARSATAGDRSTFTRHWPGKSFPTAAAQKKKIDQAAPGPGAYGTSTSIVRVKV